MKSAISVFVGDPEAGKRPADILLEEHNISTSSAISYPTVAQGQPGA